MTQTKHDRKPTTDNGQRQGYGISSPKVSQKTMILSGQQNQTDLDSKSGHTNCSISEPKCNESINNCTTATCRYCPLFNNSGTITSHSTERAYKTRRKVSCRCTNLVYCITHIQCSKQYEGQAKQTYVPFSGPSATISKMDDTIGRHFPGNHKTDDIKIHILDFIHAHQNQGREHI